MQNNEMIDTINASIYWKDNNGCYLNCNKYFLNYLGMKSKKEIIGKSDYDLYSKLDADKIRKIDISVMVNGNFYGEEYITIHGETKIFLTSKIKFLDIEGNAIGISGNSVDITALKKSIESEKRQAVMDEEAKVIQVIDLVNASIYWKDKDGRYLGCNKYVLEMAGLNSRDEIIGKTDFELLWHADAPRIRKIDESVLKTGSYQGEEYTRVANNKEKFLLTSKNRLLTHNGEVIGITGTSIDITAQKDAEKLKHENIKLEAQNKLNKIIVENEVHKLEVKKHKAEAERLRLENEVHKLENEKQNAILEEQERFRKIVGQMVHDIRSPLSSLKTLVDESSRAIPEEDRITLRQAAMRISDIAQHMLGRYKNEAVETEIAEPVLVSTSMIEVLGEKRYEYEAVNFITKFAPDSDFAFIQIEPNQFKRMISNLLNNAVEAIDGKSDGEISLNLYVGTEWVTITVADNGKGMSEELANKLESGIAVTEGKKHGSGIGLTQVRDTVKRNFGEFDIISVPEDGTSIYLKFPKIPAPFWIAEEIKLIKDDTIVILDDDHSIHGAWDAKLAPTLTKIPELTVKHFSIGIEAVSFINSLSAKEKDKICLLTDYELLKQDINGLQVIEQTKIKRSTLVTSHYANPDLQKSMTNLRVKILPKELTAKVKISLDKKIKPGSKKVDIVWVDDAKWFIRDWRRKYTELVIDEYYEPGSFLEDVAQYPLNTKIILDSTYFIDPPHNKAYAGDGYELAQKLHEKGYTNLFLITGDEPASDMVFGYLRVIFKEDHVKIKEIIKL